jgi:hypothetical protein
MEHVCCSARESAWHTPERLLRVRDKGQAAVIILAVDDLGLHWMKLQTALCQACPDDIEHKPRLLLTPAVDNRVVSVLSITGKGGVVRQVLLPAPASKALLALRGDGSASSATSSCGLASRPISLG